MASLTLEAPAKINLWLRIIGRRPDGMHDIETVFQMIRLCDDLTFENSEHDELIVKQSPWDLGPPERNLIWRALQGLRGELGDFPPVRITLRKQIPPGAGMGGGSSDAATALRGLLHNFSLRLPVDRLCRLARSLGADVPFFLGLGGDPARWEPRWPPVETCAVGRGIGDLLETVPHRSRWTCVILYPGHPSGTAEAYAAWHEREAQAQLEGPPLERVLQALRSHDLAGLEESVHNDFTESLCERFPTIRQAMALLRECGHRAVWPTGSGSAVVALHHEGARTPSPLPAGFQLIRAAFL